MTATEQKLLRVLQSIEGAGHFVAAGVRDFTLPGLQIEGIGETGFPLSPTLVEAIIGRARKAPFGKGSQTITDPAVRSAWEIDAGMLSFRNPDWEKALGNMVDQAREDLGLEGQQVTASLYKLLIYEEGDFFLPHQDSEKEKGMFGTLVVGLPSAHTGGELVVRFEGKEETIDFSTPASQYKMPFVAFYADCEHEIRPVTSGYRVVLTYNLLQSGGAVSSPHFGKQADQITALLKDLEPSITDGPKVVLLDHQYTPANFSLGQLKHHDRPRAEALLRAADQAGYFATLGLVTLYLMGEWEPDQSRYGRRGRYYEEEEPADGEMGEIIEQYTSIKYWAADGVPPLGEIDLEEEDILAEEGTLGYGDPLEQQAEGYTGNAGMTLEYWYHYGAVVLWPRSRHSDFLLSASTEVRLQWLDYYCRQWDDSILEAPEYARRLVERFADDQHPEESYSRRLDYSPLASALANLGEAFLKRHGEALLVIVFDRIAVENWLILLHRYDPILFNNVFQKAAARKDISVTSHLLRILAAAEDSKLRPFVSHQIRRIPLYLSKVELHRFHYDISFSFAEVRVNEARKNAIASAVESTLALSAHPEADAGWRRDVLQQLTCELPREYVNEILAPILLSRRYRDRALAQDLYEVCLLDLSARVATKPAPPKDWSRATPKSGPYQEIWKLLHPFLSSPTQQVLDYVRNESERREVEHAIQYTDVDLRTETIRKGRPYTLRLIKTMASHERAFTEWWEDAALLDELRAVAER